MKKDGFTVTEVIIVMVVFSVFVLGMIYLLNTYINKADRYIKLLDAVNRMTQASELVAQYLIKATGNATSMSVSESGTEVTFDIILVGNKIKAKLTVVDDNWIKYTEEDKTIDLPIDNVDVRFYMPQSRPPIHITVSTQNPFDKNATLTVEYDLYPPGIK